MTNIGDIISGQFIGKLSSQKYIWQSCIDCGKERWVRSDADNSGRCRSCASKLNPHPIGAKSHKWKGGKSINFHGYTKIWLSPDNYFFAMSDKNHNILEHRLVMAQHLRRCLQKWEVVHHKNGIKADNHIENLELQDRNDHFSIHSKGYRDGYQKGLLDGRNKQIEELKMQNDELLKQIKLLQFEIREIFAKKELI